jgi:DNA-directed RNA polymerase subunit E'/Rpb7
MKQQAANYCFSTKKNPFATRHHVYCRMQSQMTAANEYRKITLGLTKKKQYHSKLKWIKEL